MTTALVAPAVACGLVAGVLAAMWWWVRSATRSATRTGDSMPLTWGRDGVVRSLGYPPGYARPGAAAAPGPSGATLRLQWTALMTAALAHREGRCAQLAVPVRDGVALYLIRWWHKLGYAHRVGASLTSEYVTLTVWPRPDDVAVSPATARLLIALVDEAAAAEDAATAEGDVAEGETLEDVAGSGPAAGPTAGEW